MIRASQSIQRLFSRQWWKTTLLVILAAGVCIRLGIWQLDRLEQRRAFNDRVEAQVNQPPLVLEGAALEADLEAMEYRQVIVTGEYQHAGEVALRNQAWNNQMGVNLVSPLRIAGSDMAVLVNRGWIPFEDFTSNDWRKFQEPGIVTIKGIIRRSQTKPEIGWRQDVLPETGEAPLMAWNMINVAGIDRQLAYALLPVYIQQAPEPAWTGMPYRSLPALELTEGPHLGYAIQWFVFAAILGIGYPFYIRKEGLAPKERGITTETQSKESPEATSRHFRTAGGGEWTNKG
jgi:surfeit locus 1 family protein